MFKQITSGLLATTLVFGSVALANDTPAVAPATQLVIDSLNAMHDITAFGMTGDFSLSFAGVVPTPFGFDVDLSEVSIAFSDINYSMIVDMDNQDFRFFMGGTIDLVVPELLALFVGETHTSVSGGMLFDNGAVYVYATGFGWMAEPHSSISAEAFWADMAGLADVDTYANVQAMLELIMPMFDFLPMEIVEASLPGHYAIASHMDADAVLAMLEFLFAGDIISEILEISLAANPYALADLHAIDPNFEANLQESLDMMLEVLVPLFEAIDLDMTQVEYINQETLLPAQSTSVATIGLDINALLADTPFSFDAAEPITITIDTTLFFDFDADSVTLPVPVIEEAIPSMLGLFGL